MRFRTEEEEIAIAEGRLTYTSEPVYQCGVCGIKMGPQHKSMIASGGFTLDDISSPFFEHIKSLRLCNSCDDWAVRYVARLKCGVFLN